MELPEIGWWQGRKKEMDRQIQRVLRRWDGILIDWLTVEKVEEGEKINDPMFLVQSTQLVKGPCWFLY